MSSDLEWLPKFLPDTLHVHPGREGAYATLIAESEIPIAEIDVTDRTRLAVSAFFVNDSSDYGTFKITKLLWRKKSGWIEDGSVRINHFDLARMRSFVTILTSLDLRDAVKARITLGPDVQIESLSALLASDRGAELIRDLSASPELQEDIYAVAKKRRALKQFEANLADDPKESEWQAFFKSNPWIFGHGLNYVFLDKVTDRLEAATTGATFNRPGKIVDALLRTRAEVSQYVLVEIKRSGAELLYHKDYRSGCWAVSHELSDAVTQVQKTVFEFRRDHFRDRLKDALGNDLADDLYAVEPRSYLVIGNLGKLAGNDDKVTCFELYRRNIRAPEILTFDELYERARCIIENLSREASRNQSP